MFYSWFIVFCCFCWFLLLVSCWFSFGFFLVSVVYRLLVGFCSVSCGFCYWFLWLLARVCWFLLWFTVGLCLVLFWFMFGLCVVSVWFLVGICWSMCGLSPLFWFISVSVVFHCGIGLVSMCLCLVSVCFMVCLPFLFGFCVACAGLSVSSRILRFSEELSLWCCALAEQLYVFFTKCNAQVCYMHICDCITWLKYKRGRVCQQSVSFCQWRARLFVFVRLAGNCKLASSIPYKRRASL